ncbi:hypothetical protein, partial [Clostridioides difficile]|uniref:hypothetical protein n=1 Tax=Clostridioides difficile TaxID=1496 RepID=UPI001A9250E0
SIVKLSIKLHSSIDILVDIFSATSLEYYYNKSKSSFFHKYIMRKDYHLEWFNSIKDITLKKSIFISDGYCFL